MPELPEVETVRRTLVERVVGRTIERVEVLKPSQVRHPDPETFAAELTGARFTDVERRGKYLIFHLGPVRLVAHLRMTGKLLFMPAHLPYDKHTHVVFHLDGGWQLRYVDMRTFGGFHLLFPEGEGTPRGLAELGPEPLGDRFTAAYLAEALASRRSARIKAVLLDQTVVAGLGNIYVDEALHRAGVHPERPAASLGRAEVEKLHGAIRAILGQAIEERGTSFRDYVDGVGERGGYVAFLQVYGREKAPCLTCGTPIVRRRVAGRSSHICPHCQPEAGEN